MGSANVKAAYALWRHRLADTGFTVLAYMALISLDKDDPPRYFGGRHALARQALGRRSRGVESELDEADVQAVKRAVRALTSAGAITLENDPKVHERAVYRLNLSVSPGDAERTPEGVTIRTPEGDESRTPGGGRIVTSEGDGIRPPKEEEQQEPHQDLDQDPTPSRRPQPLSRASCGHRLTADGECVAGCKR